MNWKNAAISDLERYERQKQSLENICERISILEDSYTSLKTAVTDKAPIRGGSSKMEDEMLNNIVERERLEFTYNATKRLVELTEKGLDGLANDEKRILELFYIRRHKAHVERLMEELGYEKTKIYALKDKALYDFTTFMYGLTEY